MNSLSLVRVLSVTAYAKRRGVTARTVRLWIVDWLAGAKRWPSDVISIDSTEGGHYRLTCRERERKSEESAKRT